MNGLRHLWRRVAGRGPSVSVRCSGSDVLIVSGGDNASISYLLEPYLAGAGLAVRLVPPVQGRSAVPVFDAGTVVIARYLPPDWVEPLRQFRAAGGRLVYFMDDDLMDPAALHGLPAVYAKKIRALATSRRQVIESLCDEFWVASPHLAEKYRAWSPRLLQARPALAQVQGARATTVCYHGTASHQAELKWLVPVIRSVQARVADAHFEVFGDHAVNKLFRDLPRTSVLHPMSWANYLAYTGTVRRDLALAPLLPEPFNAARGPTKFFDFARMGAVGIYTDVAPYRGFVRDGIDGLLVPNEPAAWVEAIAALAADAPRRQRMADAARARALAMAWDANAAPAPAQVPV